MILQVTRGTSEYLKRCRSPGSRVWWVRSVAAGSMVNPGAAHPGHAPARMSLELEPGVYVLGCGSSTRHRFQVPGWARDGDVVRIDGRTGDVLSSEHKP